LEHLIEGAPEEDIDRAAMEKELELIESFKIADDKLAENVDLFPLFGYTPGTCGLLVTSPLSRHAHRRRCGADFGSLFSRAGVAGQLRYQSRTGVDGGGVRDRGFDRAGA